MSRAIKNALGIAVAMAALMLAAATPAGAQPPGAPPGTQVHAQFFGTGDLCPSGSGVTVVVDGETLDPSAYQLVTDFFVFGPPPASLFLANIYVTDLPPGASLMSAICDVPGGPVAGSTIQQGATNCAGLGDEFVVDDPARYTPDPFCFKILFVDAGLPLNTFTGWSWNDGSDVLDVDVTALGATGTQVLADVDVDRGSVVSIANNDAPWFVVQVVAAALGLMAMAVFVTQRRRVQA